MHIPTFHDPILSRAQSALHQALVRLEEPATEHLSAQHPSMSSLIALGQSLQGVKATDEEVMRQMDVYGECAVLYYLHCRADLMGNAQLAAEYAGQLQKGSCDPGYLEATVGYEETKNDVQYVPVAPGQGISPLADSCTVALLADWGTGAGPALAVLGQAMAQKPDLLIHMGDVYYAGSPAECQSNFVDAITSAVPGAFTPAFPVYAIPGNHEYFWGGHGFQEVIRPATGQAGSYFCLRGSAWQIVALDTGYHDRSPFTVYTNTTYLPPDQVRWLESVMASGLPTVMLTHHQLYSAVYSVGKDPRTGAQHGINPCLYDQIAWRYGPQIVVWLWGHEHNTVVFDPRPGLPPGRCVGSGGIPILVDQEPYTPNPSLVGLPGIDVPAMSPDYRLSCGEFAYNHGFATLSLTPEQATVTYFQVPQPTPANPVSGSAIPVGPPEVFANPGKRSGAAPDPGPGPGNCPFVTQPGA